MAADLAPPTGHVFRVERVRGPAWYAKYRLPDGRQVQKKLDRCEPTTTATFFNDDWYLLS